MSFSMAGAGASFPDVIDTVRPGVVAVGTVTPAHSGKKTPSIDFRGTGFAVGDGSLIVTNFHVISRELDYKNNESLVIFIRADNEMKALRAELIASDQHHDLALLHLPDSKLGALVLGPAEAAREGQEIAFTGFPMGMMLGLHPVTHRGIISAITPIVTPASSSGALTAARIKRARAPFSVYQLDGTAYPGNSGSPVYELDTGRVIGVLNRVFVKETKEAMLEKPSGISYAIPVEYVRDLLRAKP